MYLTFHIVTILIVLLMAAMRQSIMSLGYVVIIIYNIKYGSRVLSQRDQAQSEHVLLLDNEIEEAEKEIEEEQKKRDDDDSFEDPFGAEGEELK